MGTLKVASVNVRGLWDALKRRAVFEFLSNLRFDFFTAGGSFEGWRRH